MIDPQTNPLGLDSSDPNASDDILTINQLHLPVDKPAIIHLSSKDVLHSFGLPEMRVKQDIIPGLSIPTWFVPAMTTKEFQSIKGDSTITFEIACAQLCGLGHYRMRGFLTVETQAEFEAWLVEQGPFLIDDEDDGGEW